MLHRLGDLASIADTIKGNPIVVYASIGVVLLGVAASASEHLQKILGPLGRWLAARQARRAKHAASHTDVRILDMQGQLDHVVPRLDGVEAELNEVRRLVTGHTPWDWHALNRIRRDDPEFPDPPPLLPPLAPKN